MGDGGGGQEDSQRGVVKRFRKEVSSSNFAKRIRQEDSPRGFVNKFLSKFFLSTSLFEKCVLCGRLALGS